MKADPEVPEFLANRVRYFRTQQGLTQSQLANKSGLTSACVHNVESGKRTPGLATVSAISKALSLHINDLLWAPKREPKSRSHFYAKWQCLHGLAPEDDEIILKLAKRLREGSK